MSDGFPMMNRRLPASPRPVVCPPWCRGCGPNDPMHRGYLATIGREGTGWVSLQLLIDRFTRRDPAIKLDATHFGTTQTVLLTLNHVDRLIEELTHARHAMQAQAGRNGRTGEMR